MNRSISDMRDFGLTTGADLSRLAAWELDRLTAGELYCDEALTILERHGLDSDTAPIALGLRMLSRLMHDMLTEAEGAHGRHERLSRMRDVMTAAMPAAEEHGDGG